MVLHFLSCFLVPLRCISPGHQNNSGSVDLHSHVQIFPNLNYEMTTLYKNGELLTTQITSHRNLHVGFSITNFVTNNYWLHFGDYFHVKIQLWIRVFFYRPVGQNRHPPVAVNRTGLTDYRKKPAKFKI